MKGKKYAICVPCFLVLIVLSLLAGIFAPGIIQNLLDKGIEETIVLRPTVSEEIYKSFLNNTEPGGTPAFIRLYFFNITNLDDIRENDAKPILEELGPYTYREYYVHYDIDFSYDGKMSYREYKQYIPEPDMTVGNYDDKIVTLNMPFVGALTQIQERYRSNFLQWLLGFIASQLSSWSDENTFGIFTRRSVDELVWGYDDPLLGHLSRWVDVENRVSFLANRTKADADKIGPNVLDTGLREISQIGQLEQWEGYRTVSTWNSYNETVAGTDGTRFSKGMELGDRAKVWSGDLYRSLNFVASENVDFDGIKLRRLTLDPEMLKPDDRYYQRVPGLINSTNPMAFGADGEGGRGGNPPIYFSQPHFCGADPSLANGVIGLNCDEEKHTLFIDVEPYTGITLRGAKRLMMSSGYGPRFENVEPNIEGETVLPVFWLDGQAQATPDQIEEIRGSVYWALNMKELMKIVPFCIALFFVLLLLLLVAYALYKHRTARKNGLKNKFETELSPSIGESGVQKPPQQSTGPPEDSVMVKVVIHEKDTGYSNPPAANNGTPNTACNVNYDPPGVPSHDLVDVLV